MRGAKKCKSFVSFVQVFANNAETTLKSTAPEMYPVHILLLNSSAVYRQCLVENGLIFVGFLFAKLETCMESEPRGESRGNCAHYWFTDTEEVYAEEEIMLLGQGFLRQLKICLLEDAISEMMGPLYGCRSTICEVIERGERKWGCFQVILCVILLRYL